jgi:rare lipoprotein A
MKVVCRKLVFVLLALLVLPCAVADGVTAPSAHATTDVAAKAPFAQVGRATYYHKSLHGLRTANGERFDMHAMTAAHRRLKLGSYVRVTNFRNKRSVAVRINDRLPPRSRAIIDLSIKAARELGMFRRGVAKVKLELISKEEFIAENSAS